MPIAMPNTTEPSSSHDTASAASKMSLPPPITALVIVDAAEYMMSTTRSASTTEPRITVDSGPSEPVSASSAITTAGDCADSATPITKHTASVCSNVMPSKNGSNGCIKNNAPAIANCAPITAKNVIARS